MAGRVCLLERKRVALGINACFIFFSFLFFGCGDKQPVVGPYPTGGKASWYTASRTASGERFNRWDLTCAMRKLDFGKSYLVCNIANNKCVVARHNDFGPSKKMYRRGRIIDLSRFAFSQRRCRRSVPV